jgi:hypothetical protein
MQTVILVSLIQFALGAPLVATGASQSPGVGSGNVIQAPVNSPFNQCGNSVNAIGLGNLATGNTCANA